MPGVWREQTWLHNPRLEAPAKYRRACNYKAFVPDPLSSLQIQMSADVAGLVSDAERSIGRLNQLGSASLAPLARLLLRTESIASSKVEGLQIGVREMARAEVRAETGAAPSRTALELIDNINAMELALGEAAEANPFGIDQIVAIHRRLLQHAPNRVAAGIIRAQQNWIGGNDYNPCGAEFVPPPPEDVNSLL
jgi:Fic family protein